MSDILQFLWDSAESDDAPCRLEIDELKSQLAAARDENLQLRELLKACQSIIGHPDDEFSKTLVEVLATTSEDQSAL